MSTILTFLRAGSSFGPEQVAAMGKAYDDACATLKVKDGPSLVREALAANIIALASRGLTDSEYLRETALNQMRLAPTPRLAVLGLALHTKAPLRSIP